MVRNLYLLRHGQAVINYDMDDFDRPLSEVGSSQLMALGGRLKDEGFCPDRVYCSTARRTRQTIKILIEQLDYKTQVQFEAKIYEASVRTLFEIVASTDTSYSSVLIVGHNPAISYLFDYLTDGEHTGMSPGQIVHIAFVDLKWSEVSKGLGMPKAI